MRHLLTSRRLAASTKSLLSKDDMRDFSRNRLTRVQPLSSPASLIGILPYPGQQTHVVEERSAEIEHREAGLAQLRVYLALRAAVRPDQPPDRAKNRVGEHPAQAAHRAAETLAPADRLERGDQRNPAREIDEHPPATRLERPTGQPQDVERPGVRVERVDVDDLIERADPAWITGRDIGVLEGHVAQLLGPALLARQLDERFIGIDTQGREAGLGQEKRDVAGTASDVEHPDIAPWHVARRACLHARQHFTAQRLVGREAIEDVVVDDPVPDRQRALEAPVRAPDHGRFETLHAVDGAHPRSASACSTAPRSSSHANALSTMASTPITVASSMTSDVPCPVSSMNAMSGLRSCACSKTSNPFMSGIL